MAKQGTILVVDDNKGILTAVQMLLGTCFEKVITISTPNKIKNTLHDENVDVVLLDMKFQRRYKQRQRGVVLALRDQEGLSPRLTKSFSLPPTPTSIWRYEESRKGLPISW